MVEIDKLDVFDPVVNSQIRIQVQITNSSDLTGTFYVNAIAGTLDQTNITFTDLLQDDKILGFNVETNTIDSATTIENRPGNIGIIELIGGESTTITFISPPISQIGSYDVAIQTGLFDTITNEIGLITDNIISNNLIFIHSNFIENNKFSDSDLTFYNNISDPLTLSEEDPVIDQQEAINDVADEMGFEAGFINFRDRINPSVNRQKPLDISTETLDITTTFLREDSFQKRYIPVLIPYNQTVTITANGSVRTLRNFDRNIDDFFESPDIFAISLIGSINDRTQIIPNSLINFVGPDIENINQQISRVNNFDQQWQVNINAGQYLFTVYYTGYRFSRQESFGSFTLSFEKPIFLLNSLTAASV